MVRVAIGLGETPEGHARYFLNRPLAEDAIGTLWEAEDRLRHQPVTVRTIAPSVGEDEGFLEGFRDDLPFAWLCLNHPNAARILNYGFHGSWTRQFVVLEPMDGETLRDRLLREGPVALPEAVRIVAEAARAAQAAHDIYLAHGGLHSGSVVLTADYAVKVIDFGIAAAWARVVLRRSQHAPFHFSPEQIAGDDAGPSSDIYSLAILFWELLTGRADLPPGLWSAARERKDLRAWLKESLPDVPDSLLHVWELALAFHPRTRPPSAVALAAGLEEGLSVHDSPRTAHRRAAAPSPRTAALARRFLLARRRERQWRDRRQARPRALLAGPRFPEVNLAEILPEDHPASAEILPDDPVPGGVPAAPPADLGLRQAPVPFDVILEGIRSGHRAAADPLFAIQPDELIAILPDDLLAILPEDLLGVLPDDVPIEILPDDEPSADRPGAGEAPSTPVATDPAGQGPRDRPHPVRPSGSGAGRRRRRPVSRRRVVAGLGVAALLLGAAVGGVGVLSGGIPSDEGGRSAGPVGSAPPGQGSGAAQIGEVVRVPEVLGLRARAARKELRRAGLRPAKVLTPSATPGRVVGTVPSPGSQVRVGTEVVLVVGEPAEPTETVAPVVPPEPLATLPAAESSSA